MLLLLLGAGCADDKPGNSSVVEKTPEVKPVEPAKPASADKMAASMEDLKKQALEAETAAKKQAGETAEKMNAAVGEAKDQMKAAADKMASELPKMKAGAESAAGEAAAALKSAVDKTEKAAGEAKEKMKAAADKVASELPKMKAGGEAAAVEAAATLKTAVEKTEKVATEAATAAQGAAEKMAAETRAAANKLLGKETAKVKLGDPALTAGIPGTGPLTTEQITAWLDNPANHATLEVELPLGLDAGAGSIRGLDKNPLTRAKIELGRQLYFDTRLSKDNTISCASCHSPEAGYAAHTQFGVGVDGQMGGRNSPTAYNRILSDLQFWDGRADSLEAQAKGPIANPIEMASSHEAVVALLQANEGYRKQFEKVFGSVSIDHVAAAIASFERVIVTGASPYDLNEKLRAYANVDLDDLKTDDPAGFKEYEAIRAMAANHPMSDSAKRGREIFFTEKGNCTACHVGPNLTDEKYHNIGVGMSAAQPDLGRSEISKDDKERGAFKTPTIRNVAQTAPYMHDGATKTLADVVEFYAKGGEPNTWLDPKIKKLDLTAQDKADLVAFMEACTGPLPKVETGRLPQ